MAAQPETRFYTSVHRQLPKELHFEKMHNEYRGGTPDVWYSGKYSDLWIEYKWLSTVPVKADIYVTKMLSALQLRWLNSRYAEGRNVAVVLGTPEGCWIYEDRNWNDPLNPKALRGAGLTKHSVADFITLETGGPR